ncbi:MAG: NAD(P)/FAD-dependent oxidoreductase [Mycoplasmoidaceae bacterium]
MSKNKIYDVLIIGAGPGGMSAAIYAKRSNLDVALIERSAPGGKLVLTSVIENYPGFSTIAGYDLASKIYKQVKDLNIDHYFGDVNSFDKVENNFIISTTDNKKYFSKSLILATGMTENKFNIIGEEKFYGKGISYCAICDGSFFKNKIVAVLGGGNSALKEARFLANIAKKVYLIHALDEFQGQKIELEKTSQINNINVFKGKKLLSFNGSSRLESITYLDIHSSKEETLKIDGAFSFIGYKPITNYINSKLVKLDNGFIKVNQSFQTFTPGIYAIGDVLNKPYRQIVIAESDGAIAALEVEKFINSKSN